MSKENLKNKGITLIALIITIIVMLILTGVTLSIALGENGIVNQAKLATAKMQLEMDRELLLSAVVGAISEDGTFVKANILLPEGFTLNGDVYTSAKGNSFTVSETGEIAIAKNETPGGGDIIEDGEGEVITNPWIAKGLSADWVYGKWYVYDEAGGEHGAKYGGKWFYLGEDGSFSQGDSADGEMLRLSSEEVDGAIDGGIVTLNGNEFIANGQWKSVLDENGNATLLWYSSDTGEYAYSSELIVADESDYEYNLDGIYLREDGKSRYVFSSENRTFYREDKMLDETWKKFNEQYFWGFRGTYNFSDSDMEISEDLNTIHYTKTYTYYIKQAN